VLDMAKTSIQRRLIAAIVISQLVLAIGLIDVAVFVTRAQLRKAFDVALQGRAMSIAALVRYSEDESHKLLFESDLAPPPLEPGVPDLYEVFANDHTLIVRSPNWPAKVAVSPPQGDQWIATYMVNGVRYRVLRLERVPVLDREGDAPATDFLRITYASPIDPVTRAVSDVLLYIAVGSLLLLVISGGFAFWALRRSLRPLEALANSAGAISTSNWELNPPEEARDTLELAPLTQAMTSMLDGLHRSFTQQREFLANAAHELKTPVAILKSTLQSLLQRPRTTDEYSAGLEEALDDMARLEKLLHSMLRLARAEQWAAGSLRRDLAPVEVGMTCQLAIERMQAVAQQRGVNIDFTVNGPLRLPADPDDLELVWSNLLENAIRFSPRGETVRMSMRTNDGRGYVEVADKGPGIPPSELPRIFERFHRGDSSRARDTGGYGLGLAISKALIEAYGGTIEPHSSLGEGTRMVVSLPV
jgi:signal transduction histidine kinase